MHAQRGASHAVGLVDRVGRHVKLQKCVSSGRVEEDAINPRASLFGMKQVACGRELLMVAMASAASTSSPRDNATLRMYEARGSMLKSPARMTGALPREAITSMALEKGHSLCRRA